MSHNFWQRSFSMILLLGLILIAISPVTAGAPAQKEAPQQDGVGTKLTNPDVSNPVFPVDNSGLPPAPTVNPFTGENAEAHSALMMPKTAGEGEETGFVDPVAQTTPVQPNMPAPLQNWEAQNIYNGGGYLPPDTDGQVGPNHYIQMVNVTTAIYNKTGSLLYGPFNPSALWPTGNPCRRDDGDGVVLYDQLADRWVLSQFSLPNYPNGPYYECFAISKGPTPTNVPADWWVYTFLASNTKMDDYPKLGVWPDGYYMTANQFTGAGPWGGLGVWSFERTKMLAGQAAQMVYFDLYSVNPGYGGALPSNLMGPTPPPVGTPNYFGEVDMDWSGTNDIFHLWEFHVDWVTPANSTFTLVKEMVVALFDNNLCPAQREMCIDQPGTSNKLEAITDRLMMHMWYRNLGDHQSLVVNHTVDWDGNGHAGIRWYEIRAPGVNASIYQQGTYSPDSSHRWMGSIAMDRVGDIALGYSISDATSIYPGIRYTGRLATDPLGTMPQGEATIINGTGSITGYARWGDYSAMSVDPVDDCTFWYTQEYVSFTNSAVWQTRIASFKFPSCVPPTGIALDGTVTDDASEPLTGATIDVSGGYTTITDDSGHYALSLEDGVYSITASKYGYISSTVPGLIVNPPGTTQDFALDTAPISTISGVVTDAITGWPLYARIDISGFPNSPVFSDPVTGEYSVSISNGSYTISVKAMSGGYTPTILPLVITTNAIQDYSLTVDPITCTAPGYSTSPPDLFENFEAWPLAGWTIVDNIVGGGLNWDTNSAYNEPNNTGGVGLAATVSSDNATGDYDTELQTPVIDPTTLSNLNLIYKANYQQSNLDALDLDIKNFDDISWTNISHWTTNHGARNGLPGDTVSVNLTAYITGNFQLRWHYYTPENNPSGMYVQIDEVALGTGCVPNPSSGLVIGSVFDANHNATITNASVKDTDLKPALIIDNSADTSQVHPMYMISEPAGEVILTASAPFYVSDTQPTTVQVYKTVRQNFTLEAGMLAPDPTSLIYTVLSPTLTSSKPLTLFNDGGALTIYEVFAIPGTFGGYEPVGPFADHARHFGRKNLNDLDASKIIIDLTPTNIPMISGGTVSASWSTGLTYAWGIGFNTEATDLWLGDLQTTGGDGFIHRFTTDGINTGDTIDTSSWVSGWNADMTYNPFTNMLWQVSVSGDKCIYELDPTNKTSTGNKICPAFEYSERGLAFDPLTNTYYAGSWNDGIINHFAPDGTLIDSAAVNLNISGLAFNPGTGHLFAMTSNTHPENVFDVYVLDTKNAYNILGGFYIIESGVDVFASGGQAGLEIDCAGNLWAVDQFSQKVYVAESGETGICDWQSSWLSVAPTSGSVQPGGNTTIDVSVDASGMPFGTYLAYLRFVTNTPYGDEIVPVTLNFYSYLITFLPVINR